MAGNEADRVMVKAKRPFEGMEGFKDERSPSFGVSRHRLAELKANDLVEEDEGSSELKQAPEPANKMAPTLANKARSDAGKAEKA